MHQEPAKQEEYYSRLKWLILGRAVLVTFLLGSLAFFQYRYQVYQFRAANLLYFIIFLSALSGAYGYLLRKLGNLLLFAYLQIAGDILLVTFLVILTGGIDSGFSVLYHFVIISASIILYRRGGYLSASFASILYGGILDMQYYNVFILVRSQSFTAMQVFYQVFTTILSFYIVAFLSSYLSDRLRKTSQELQQKSTDFEGLLVFQEHILRSVGSGILTMDLVGNITSWNPAAENITGYSYLEIKGRWRQVFGRNIERLFGHTDDLKRGPYRFDGALIKKDGSKALIGVTASLLRDETDTVRGIILIFQDITRFVEMEEQVRRQERLVTVGSLAAGIAHEIRNPLASLSGSIEVLKSELKLRGDDKHLMDIVIRETERLNTIIKEFLEYARPKPPRGEQIPINSLMNETITLFKNSKDFREDITIQTDIDRRAKVQADPQRMRQVFWNLLINASQALTSGGEITIRASARRGSEGATGWTEILLSDSGQGIAPEHIGKIFDPFFTTKAEGTGLGLAIVHRIIADHGGTIAVESEQEKGTRFKIRLPMSEERVFAERGT